MRVAVLSDIHANLRALDAILARIGAVDEIWHLGDVVGYGPDPDAVVGRLRQLGARGVQGNHDLAATGDDVIRDFNADARSAMEWTRRVISAETLDWLAALPPTLTIGSFNLAHGSPRDPTWEYILSTAAAAANLAIMPTAWGLFGHTHLPWAYLAAPRSGSPAAPSSQVGPIEEVEPAAEGSLGLANRLALVNPGSVGQPRDGNPASSGLILDTDTVEVSWVRAPYDIKATQAAMRSAGLPPRGVERLSQGF
ncbi:MAG TPA: metallophosphoesterase family protein [Candidatus Limnocylindrales bacterium]|jgi:predicted phosphodiesterase